MKIGLVDLDTSHPAAWVPILRELGHDVVGIYAFAKSYQRARYPEGG